METKKPMLPKAKRTIIIAASGTDAGFSTVGDSE
jgi:hypothetical protein